MKGLKEVTIEFLCSEDLIITTLKEFFEIFIMSIKNNQTFHLELLSSQYSYIGLSMEFNNFTSIGNLKLLLA